MKPNAPRTFCVDGSSLSIQASKFHYSTPREDEGPYSAFEVGFIKGPLGEDITPPEAWRQYADGKFPNNAYAYVPKELIDEFIAQCGGKDESQKR